MPRTTGCADKVVHRFEGHEHREWGQARGRQEPPAKPTVEELRRRFGLDSEDQKEKESPCT